MLLISYFSINTAAATTAVQSHDCWLHYTTHSDIHLAVTLTWKYEVYWNLLDKTSNAPQTKKLGWVSKQAKRTTILNSLSGEKYSVIVHPCWNVWILVMHEAHCFVNTYWHTFQHVWQCVLQTFPVGRSWQMCRKYPGVLLESHGQHRTRHWWKVLAGTLFDCCMFFLRTCGC